MESVTSHLWAQDFNLNLNHSYSESVYHRTIVHFFSLIKSDDIWGSVLHVVGIPRPFLFSLSRLLSLNAVIPLLHSMFHFEGILLRGLMNHLLTLLSSVFLLSKIS